MKNITFKDLFFLIAVVFGIVFILLSFFCVMYIYSKSKIDKTAGGQDYQRQVFETWSPEMSSTQYEDSQNINREEDVSEKMIGTLDESELQNKTVNDKYGIASGGNLIHLSRSDLGGYFDDLKDLGVGWIRWDVDWSAIQPSGPDEYNWKGADRVAETAEKYGIKSLGTITYSPRWAHNEACDTDKQCSPADIDEFARFAGMVAKRYKNTIDSWEIWNEPNHHLFWSPQPNVEDYASLLKASYTEIKKANPQAIVISGGLAVTESGESGNIPQTEFIKSLYNLDARDYFDAVALHPYTYPASPDYVASWNGWQQIKTIRQLMADNGDSDKRIWVTEFGAPTEGSGTEHSLNELDFVYNSDYMNEDAQNEMAEKVVDLYNNDKDRMGPFFWYSLRDRGSDRDTTENFFGLIRYDGTRKPAFETLKNIFLSDK